MKLKKKFKEKWLKALRSGRYEQGTGSLVQQDGEGGYQFCCLGVACDVLMREGVELKFSEDEYGACSYSGHEELPPMKALKNMFVPSSMGLLPDNLSLKDVKVKIGFYHKSLYDHNDEGATFEQIANAIEEQL